MRGSGGSSGGWSPATHVSSSGWSRLIPDCLAPCQMDPKFLRNQKYAKKNNAPAKVCAIPSIPSVIAPVCVLHSHRTHLYTHLLSVT